MKHFKLLFALGLIGLIFILLLDIVPRNALFHNRVVRIRKNLLDYGYKNKKIPYLLQEIASNKDSTDIWGRPLIYIVDTNKSIITITSLGADGKSGGINEDSDLIWEFYYKDSNEDWLSSTNYSLFPWIHQPLIDDIHPNQKKRDNYETMHH